MNWKRSKYSHIKYFISIGAGLNQIPLIKEAKKQKFQVIGIDKNVASPGFINCDLKIQESIEDYKEIHTKLLELLIDGKIYGILTKSFGNAIKTTSYLNEKFEIPFLPFDKCDYFINKKIMKNTFIINDIQTPETLNFTSRTKFSKMSDSQFPIIAKPVVGHGKTGVSHINKPNEMKKVVDQNKRNKENYIYEKFVNGDEIIVAGIIYKSKFHLIDITDKETTYPPHFVDKIHISPSKYYHLYDKLQEIGQKVTHAFGIDTSPMIMEFVIDDNEEIFLIEAVPEFGGEFISDIIIPQRLGYNFIGEMIKAITEGGFKPPIRKKTKNYVICRYIIGKNGTLASCNPKGPASIRGILFSRIFKEIGSKVVTPVTNHDRIGVVVGKGKTLENAMRITEKAEESFNIKIKD